MPRPALSQLAVGTLAVVATTVALLALSGAQSVLAVTLLVLLCLTLGTVTAARRGRHGPGRQATRRSRRPTPAARSRQQGARTQVVARGDAPATPPLRVPEPERVAH
ncbi:hypothetical protein [Streptacidiphilus fuscans]|uniref:Uncharacterized protein n=1 Tax=Streptacidiphilus fuscans TaxID=2789292 RepID=A0A931FI21_9ACTN|nr:hypothetical protein [Streptacidiphilus fuscans]MBF9072441.1 hypothetical protein [Streptacidiphilus fuscans]